jgi:hypothetical protein
MVFRFITKKGSDYRKDDEENNDVGKKKQTTKHTK